MLVQTLKAAGYAAWFVAALVISLYLSIPNDRVKKFAQHKASVALKTQVKIRSVTIRGISGVTLNGVQITIPIIITMPGSAAVGGPAENRTPASKSAAGGGKEEDPPPILNPPGLVSAEEIVIDVNTVGLLMGAKLKAKMQAKVSGGTITDATFERTKDGWITKVAEIDNVDLGPTRLFQKFIKTDIHTRLSGNMELTWRGSLEQSQGHIALRLADTLVPHLEIRDPKSGFPVEAFQLHAGEVEIEATLDKKGNIPGLGGRPDQGPTTLVLEKLTARGDSIEVQLDSGQKHTLTFNGTSISKALIDIKLVVFFTEDFYKWRGDGIRSDGTIVKDVSHELLKPVLEGATSPVRSARIKLGKRFYYGFRCRGSVKNFKCLPAPPSRRIAPRIGTKDKKKAKPGKLNRPKPPSAKKAPSRPSAGKSSRSTRKLVEPARPRTDKKSSTARPLRAPKPSIPKIDVDPEPIPPSERLKPTPTVGEASDDEKDNEDDDDEEDDDEEDDEEEDEEDEEDDEDDKDDKDDDEEEDE